MDTAIFSGPTGYGKQKVNTYFKHIVEPAWLLFDRAHFAENFEIQRGNTDRRIYRYCCHAFDGRKLPVVSFHSHRE